jgi:hypothetical protein
MPTCPVCGGNISAQDQNCPYCGKTQLRLGGGPQDPTEWDLLAEDNAPGTAPPPGGATAESDTSVLAEDWMLPEHMLDSHPPAAPQAPRAPSPFDFTFDLEQPAAVPTAEPPPPVALPPLQPGNPPTPAWLVPEADLGVPIQGPVITPVPVTPVPVTPVPVTPVAPPAVTPPQPPPVVAAPVEATPVFASPIPVAPVLPPAPAPVPPPPARARVCPSCNKTYGADYNDSFCDCGTELIDAPPPPPPEPPKPTAAPQRPPAGTRCLVLYGPDKQPVRYFALDRDAMLVGRLDPASGCFPEIDVGEWVDQATARKVSRKHALILRLRNSDKFTLRALPGNTGTQVEKRLLAASEEAPLTNGTRVILGGAVRFKFEVM